MSAQLSADMTARDASAQDVQLVWRDAANPHIFQSPAWLALGEGSGAVHVRRFVAIRGGRPVASLCAFGSTLAGRPAVLWSGGTGGGGGPIFVRDISDQERRAASRALISYIMERAESEGYARAIVCTYPGDADREPCPGISFRQKWTPLLELGTSAPELLAAFPKDVRYDISKARDAGVEVAAGTRDDLLWYRQWQLAFAKEKGIPSWRVNSHAALLRAYDTLAPSDSIRIYVARYQGRPVGAALYLYAGDAMFYKSGSYLPESRALRAGYALQWRAMSDAIDRGVRSYNLMGAHPEPEHPHHSITRFKMSFGAALAPFGQYGREFRHPASLLMRAYARLAGRPLQPVDFIYP